VFVDEPELVVRDVHDALVRSLQEVWDTATFWGGFGIPKVSEARRQRDDFHWAKFCATCQMIDDEYDDERH
jgi:hypothetical protein